MDFISPTGYALFYTDPDEYKVMFCLICGTRCQVERSLHDATCWIEGMARRGHWHDKFTCPHIQEDWHEQALKLVSKIRETPSKRLAKIMRLDLEDVLREHGCGQNSPALDNPAINRPIEPDISHSHAAIIALHKEMLNDEKFKSLCLKADIPWNPDEGYQPRGYNGPPPQDVQVLLLMEEPATAKPGELKYLLPPIIYRPWNKLIHDVLGEYFWVANLFDLVMMIRPKESAFQWQSHLGGSYTFWMPLPEGKQNQTITGEVEEYFLETYLTRLLNIFPKAIILAAGNRAQRRLSWLEVDYVPCAGLTAPEAGQQGAKASWEMAAEEIARLLDDLARRSR